MDVADIETPEIESLKVAHQGVRGEAQQNDPDRHTDEDPRHRPTETDHHPDFQGDKEFGEEKEKK